MRCLERVTKPLALSPISTVKNLFEMRNILFSPKTVCSCGLKFRQFSVKKFLCLRNNDLANRDAADEAYRIPAMTESRVASASNCSDSELALTIFFRKDFARIFHTEWKLKSEKISREKTSREIFR